MIFSVPAASQMIRWVAASELIARLRG